MKNKLLNNIALSILEKYGVRQYEFNAALHFLKDCKSILDVGCGRGTFIAKDPARISGLEYNQKNVEFCQSKGFKVIQGDALNMHQIANDQYDGVYCSHLIQVFDYLGAIKLLNELRRVVKPGGVIVLVTFSAYKRMYDTPETVRAYPPHAIRSLIKQPHEFVDPSAAPTYDNAPKLKQEDIYLIRPALCEFNWQRNEFLDGMSSMINIVQHLFFLRKYWSHWNYVVKLRNGDK